MNIVDDAWATLRLTTHPWEITQTLSYVHDDSLILNESCPRKRPGLFYHHPGISFSECSMSPFFPPITLSCQYRRLAPAPSLLYPLIPFDIYFPSNPPFCLSLYSLRFCSRTGMTCPLYSTYAAISAVTGDDGHSVDMLAVVPVWGLCVSLHLFPRS